MESALTSIKNDFANEPLKYIFFLLVLLITFVKLNLSGEGFLAFSDELRYGASGEAWNHLKDGKWGAVIIDIFSTQARPGDVIIHIIPNAIQQQTGNVLQLKMYESENSFPLFYFNFIIHCLLLIVHYKFSKILLRNSGLAMMSVILFASLTNSFLYLRHALPYDAGLLIFYFVLYKIVDYQNENSHSFPKSFLLGILSFFGFLVYPGYFPLLILCVVTLFIFQGNEKPGFRKLIHPAIFISGSLLLLLVFEWMSGWVGGSYLQDALFLSESITQGSFEESFSFILKYLFQVEGISGIILLAGLIVFAGFLMFPGSKKRQMQYAQIRIVGFAVILLFLGYAASGYFFHQMVFSGRFLHQYMPFFCIFSLFQINEVISKFTIRKSLVISIFSFVFILNFAYHFVQYQSIAYPRDIAWKVGKTIDSKYIQNVFEYENCHSSFPEPENFNSPFRYPNESDSENQYILVNSCAVYPANDLTKFNPFSPEPGFHLLESHPYYLNCKAYQFEIFSIREREIMEKMNLAIKIYSDE